MPALLPPRVREPRAREAPHRDPGRLPFFVSRQCFAQSYETTRKMVKLRPYLQVNLSYVTYFFSAATLSRCDLVLRRVRRERVGQVCPECGAKFSDAKEIPSAPLEGGRRLELAFARTDPCRGCLHSDCVDEHI